MSDKRGKGTTIKTFCWPLDKLNVLTKAEELSRHRGLSGLIQEVLTEWVMKQESVIEDNPIGLRYNSGSSAAANSRRWIDAILEPDEQKAREDIQLIEDKELLSRISVRSKKVNDVANVRAMELWHMKRGRFSNTIIARGGVSPK